MLQLWRKIFLFNLAPDNSSKSRKDYSLFKDKNINNQLKNIHREHGIDLC